MSRIEALSWNEQAEEHIRRHGVTFWEVEEAVQHIGYARNSKSYLLVIGQKDAGRYLTVVLDDEGEGIWHPVTARPATQSERRLFLKSGGPKER